MNYKVIFIYQLLFLSIAWKNNGSFLWFRLKEYVGNMSKPNLEEIKLLETEKEENFCGIIQLQKTSSCMYLNLIFLKYGTKISLLMYLLKMYL